MSSAVGAEGSNSSSSSRISRMKGNRFNRVRVGCIDSTAHAVVCTDAVKLPARSCATVDGQQGALLQNLFDAKLPCVVRFITCGAIAADVREPLVKLFWVF
jgi:hypothetical protein